MNSAILGDWIYSFPRTVIDFVQEGLPYYDFINPLIIRLAEDTSENGTFSNIPPPATVISEVLLWLTPTIVIIALLALTCLSIYIAACCYPCCRAKGYCCAHGNRRLMSCHNFKFGVCLLINIIFILSLLLGVGIGFIANSQVSSSLRNLPDSLLSALEDGFDYANDTMSEALFAVTDQLDMAISSANSNLQNIETELVEPVLNTLEPLYTIVLNNASGLLDQLENSITEVANINATIDDLHDQISQLNSTLTSLESTFKMFIVNCRGNVVCEEAVPSVPSINSIDGLIDPVETVDILGDVGINATREHLMNSTAIINNITAQIIDRARDFNISSNNSMFSFVSSMESFRDTVNRDNEAGAFNSISNILNTVDMLFEDYELYRLIAGVVLYGIFLALALTFIIGTAVGVVGCRNKREPHQRTRLTHCGGTAIYGGIAASFLLAGVILLISIPLYFFGSLFQKICNDLAPPQYVLLTTTVDNTSLFEGSTLIGSLLVGALNATTLRLSISEALTGCERNEPLYQALQLDEAINLTEFLLQLGEISEERMLDMLDTDFLADLTLDEILPEDTRRSIEDIPESLDPGRTDDLNQSVLDSSLEALVSNLTDLADLYVLLGMPIEADRVIMVRDNLVQDQLNNSIRAIETKKMELMAGLRGVNDSLQDAMTQSDDLLILLYIFHNETASVLRTEILDYVRQMTGYFTGYLRYLANIIENDLGRCQAVPEVYRTIYSTVCTDFLDGINGTWLGVVWCVSACITLIIAGTTMAPFFRKGPISFSDDTWSRQRTSSEAMYDRYHRSSQFPAPINVAPAPPTPYDRHHVPIVPPDQSHDRVPYGGQQPHPGFPSAQQHQLRSDSQTSAYAQVPSYYSISYGQGQPLGQPMVPIVLPPSASPPPLTPQASLPPSFSQIYPYGGVPLLLVPSNPSAPSSPPAPLSPLLLSATPSGLQSYSYNFQVPPAPPTGQLATSPSNTRASSLPQLHNPQAHSSVPPSSAPATNQPSAAPPTNEPDGRYTGTSSLPHLHIQNAPPLYSAPPTSQMSALPTGQQSAPPTGQLAASLSNTRASSPPHIHNPQVDSSAPPSSAPPTSQPSTNEPDGRYTETPSLPQLYIQTVQPLYSAPPTSQMSALPNTHTSDSGDCYHRTSSLPHIHSNPPLHLPSPISQQPPPPTSQQSAPPTSQQPDPSTSQQSVPPTSQQPDLSASQQSAPPTNQSLAPLTNQQSAPPTNQSSAPLTNQQSAPPTNQSSAPLTNQQSAPPTNQSSAPLTNQQSAPSTATSQQLASDTNYSGDHYNQASSLIHSNLPLHIAPPTSQQPTPSTNSPSAPHTTSQQSAPPTNQSSALLTNQQSAPPTNQSSAPLTNQQSAPLTNQSSAPLTSQQSAPPTNQSSAPLTNQQSAPPTSPQLAPPTNQSSPPLTGRQSAPSTVTSQQLVSDTNYSGDHYNRASSLPHIHSNLPLHVAPPTSQQPAPSTNSPSAPHTTSQQSAPPTNQLSAPPTTGHHNRTSSLPTFSSHTDHLAPPISRLSVPPTYQPVGNYTRISSLPDIQSLQNQNLLNHIEPPLHLVPQLSAPPTHTYQLSAPHTNETTGFYTRTSSLPHIQSLSSHTDPALLHWTLPTSKMSAPPTSQTSAPLTSQLSAPQFAGRVSSLSHLHNNLAHSDPTLCFAPPHPPPYQLAVTRLSQVSGPSHHSPPSSPGSQLPGPPTSQAPSSWSSSLPHFHGLQVHSDSQVNGASSTNQPSSRAISYSLPHLPGHRISPESSPEPPRPPSPFQMSVQNNSMSAPSFYSLPISSRLSPHTSFLLLPLPYQTPSTHIVPNTAIGAESWQAEGSTAQQQPRSNTNHTHSLRPVHSNHF